MASGKNKVLRIAVLADTHDRLQPVFPEILDGATEIWHLGDVCRAGILSEINPDQRPLSVVRGNCDAVMKWPITLDLERFGLRFRLQHIPPDDPWHECERQSWDIFLHGHTHVPRDEADPAGSHRRILNPGCVTRPNRGAGPSFAWLEIRDNGSVDWRLVELRAHSAS